MLSNEQFWKLVDAHESGEMSEDKIFDKLVALNDGDTFEAEEDLRLIQMQ